MQSSSWFWYLLNKHQFCVAFSEKLKFNVLIFFFLRIASKYEHSDSDLAVTGLSEIWQWNSRLCLCLSGWFIKPVFYKLAGKNTLPIRQWYDQLNYTSCSKQIRIDTNWPVFVIFQMKKLSKKERCFLILSTYSCNKITTTQT